MPKKVLIVVDMLNDFIDEKGVLYCGETARRIVPFIRQRVNTCTENGDLIVFLQDAHDTDDREFEKFPKHCVAGSWGSEVIPELPRGPETVIVPKKRYSGFYGTGLARILTSAGAEKAEVVGVCTSICVMDTVGGLANRDYAVTVPIQGVADFDLEFHEFALKRMKQLYGADVS